MKTKQEFRDKHNRTTGCIGIYLDALKVMDAIEAQIHAPKFKVGDRVLYVGREDNDCRPRIVEKVRTTHTYDLEGQEDLIYREHELEPYVEPPTMPTVEEFVEALKAHQLDTGATFASLIARYDAAREADV